MGYQLWLVWLLGFHIPSFVTEIFIVFFVHILSYGFTKWRKFDLGKDSDFDSLKDVIAISRVILNPFFQVLLINIYASKKPQEIIVFIRGIKAKEGFLEPESLGLILSYYKVHLHLHVGWPWPQINVVPVYLIVKL